MKFNLLFFAMMLSLSTLFSQNTVYNVIESSPDHNVLKTAIDAAGLDITLQGDGPFTVFAPTDNAFAALDPTILNEIISDPKGALVQVLLYHVLGSYTLTTDLTDELEVETLNGQTVLVTFGGGEIFINNAQITIENNIETDNGVVHVIDAVLLPELSSGVTIATIIEESPDHEILEDALIAAELYDILNDEDAGPFTVFAPTDAAFDALPDGLLELLLEDPTGQLADILLYHVVEGAATSGDLSDGQFLYPMGGGVLTITIDAGDVFVNGVQITVADIEASNGVVHVIDAVLIPTPCLQFLQQWADFNNIFGGAPSPDEEGNCETFTITDFEVYAGELYVIDNFIEGVEYTFSICEGEGAETWPSDLTIFTAEGQLVDFVLNDCSINWISPSNGTFFIGINDSEACGAETTNFATNNGNPSLTCQGEPVMTNTVFDIIQNSADHTTLTAALVAADLDTTLMGAGPFTVFAPNDDAFDALPDGMLEEILENTELLTSILLYHVVSGTILEGDLSDGQELITLSNGDQVTITFDNGGVFINNAEIIVTDLMADNGVVHVIDAVLNPDDVSVNRRNISNDLKFFPNPATHEIYIEGSDFGMDSTYELHDLSGRILRTGNLTQGQAISVNGLSAGYYTITIKSESGVRVGKFSKI